MFRKTSSICQCHLHSWKKCWKVPIRVLALMLPPSIVKSGKFKKFKNKFGGKEWQMFEVLAKFHEGMSFVGASAKKQSALQNRLFFCHDFHECRSLMKLGKHLEHLLFFTTIFFFNFFDFFRVHYSWWYQKS